MCIVHIDFFFLAALHDEGNAKRKKDYDISLSNELQEIPDEIKKMIEKHEEEDNTP